MSRLRRVAAQLPGASTVRRRWFPARPTWPPVRQAISEPTIEDGWTSGPPSFIGLGAQRAGTSWWHALISRHPEVHTNAGVPKEVHYFDRYFLEEWAADDAAGYHRLFARPSGSIVGEWTPEYMVWPWCPPLIAESCPDAKLLVTLRDPVERFHAGWAFSTRRGAPRVATIAGDAFARGLYHRQLAWLLEHVPRERVLVLQYERCMEATERELGRTYEFLEIDAGFRPTQLTDLVKAVHPKGELPARLRHDLTAAYRRDVEALVQLLPEIDLGLWPNFR